jgi:hypothetical protein
VVFRRGADRGRQTRARGHRRGNASTRLPQFKAVNTFLGNLKRSLSGAYPAFDFAKYAHRYLAEAQYRFNRRFDLRRIMARLLRAACLSDPPPAHVIRVAEVRRQTKNAHDWRRGFGA